VPDTNNREFGSKEENERYRNVHKADQSAQRARLEKDLEQVEEDRSGQRARGGAVLQFTESSGEGQERKS
jgi:hypothetical protein